MFNYRRSTLIIFKRLWKYTLTSNKLCSSTYRLFQKEHASRLLQWLTIFLFHVLYSFQIYHIKSPFESMHPSFRSLQRILLEAMFVKLHIPVNCVNGILTTLPCSFWVLDVLLLFGLLRFFGNLHHLQAPYWIWLLKLEKRRLLVSPYGSVPLKHTRTKLDEEISFSFLESHFWTLYLQYTRIMHLHQLKTCKLKLFLKVAELKVKIRLNKHNVIINFTTMKITSVVRKQTTLFFLSQTLKDAVHYVKFMSILQNHKA